MPQSSLLGWLSKRSQSSEQPIADKSTDQVKNNDLPTPPSSSQENISSPPPTAAQSELNGTSSTITNGNKNLPTNLELRACTKEDIPRLKQLNSLLLPIPYPEHFYRETIQDSIVNNITLLAIWQQDLTDPKIARKEKETLIGAIRCRILNSPPESTGLGSEAEVSKDGPMLYLSTLVLLSPFRGQGIATSMLDIITKRAVSDYGVTSVGAHVWEANLEGLEWYRKRGFSELRREESYYPRLKPTAAVVMQRRIGVLDLVGG